MTVAPRAWGRRWSPWSAGPSSRGRPDDLLVLTIRVGVVTSLLALVLSGGDVEPTARPLALVMVGLAGGYGAGLLAARLAHLPPPPTWVVSTADSVFAIAACALTGGSKSLAVAVLPLVVIAASLRAESRWGVGLAAVLGAAFTGAGLLAGTASPPAERLLIGLWWTFYLLATAALVGVFTRRLRRGYELNAESRAEVLAERAAREEERDLRARMLESQQARFDGLRVILHEFRTPVASLAALARGAGQRQEGPGGLDDAVLALIVANARHLEDMLDGLADVALADGNPTGRVRDRTVRLADLATGVLQSAGVPEERRSSTVDPVDSTVICDPQRLRRILVNLTENAVRHSASAVVELDMTRLHDRLVVEVRDRGPGLPEAQLGVVTSKYTSMGDRLGTSGLGLWIVEQLTTSMDGLLTLRQRPGGGLIAHLEIPVRRA
jgi:signal transduction histidine kinase